MSQADTQPAATAGPRSARAALGRLGEQLAAAHLERHGFSVLERNARTRPGEIDLIAWNGSTLVFVEVKTRRAASQAAREDPDRAPLAWLRDSQQVRIRRLARAWLADPAQHHPRAEALRFDAVGVLLDARGKLLRLDHLEGAW